MVKPIHTFILVILSMAQCSIVAQDQGFSQFNAIATLYNPAFSGVERLLKVSLLHRDQWPGLDQAYRTQVFAISAPIQQLNSGWAILVNHDNQANGAIRSTQIGASYAYQIQISNQWYFSMGIHGSWVGVVMDPSQLQYGDQFDPRQGLIYQSAEKRVITQSNRSNWQAGGLAYNSRWALGVSIDHMAPNSSTNPSMPSLPARKWTWHGSGRFPLDPGNPKGWFLVPNLVWQKQNDFHFLNAGCYVENNVLTLGGWYRHNVGMVGLVGLRLKSILLGYSYDYTFLPLLGTGGAHEISIRYQHLQQKKHTKKRKRIKRLPCPQF